MPNTYTLPTDPSECAGGIVSPDAPCATFNVAVQIIDSKIYRITQELTKNVSSRVTAFSADDVERISSYYDELLRVIGEVGGSISDVHGLIQWPLASLTEIQVPVENEAANAALAYLWTGDYNLRVSQSSRINDGLLATDKKDLEDLVNKSRQQIDGFVASSNPMDMPQSNPRQPVISPAGA